MLLLQNLTYIHPNKEVLFDCLHLTLPPHAKIALIGNNGVGKSSLLQIMAGILPPTSGVVHSERLPYYVPQLVGKWNSSSVSQALGVEDKLTAFHQILAGEANELNLAVLEDDWAVEERCLRALARWKLEDVDLSQKMETLSGGQKTKVFLAGIAIRQPEIILMDEPSNHLDTDSRRLLYELIQSTSSTLMVVSHDRALLDLLDSVYELSNRGVTLYGGNYDFYVEQKSVERNALLQEVSSKEKAWRKAKELERETMERQQKLDARGKKKQEKAGLPTISMKTFKNKAENSTARAKEVHREKIGSIAKELNQLRNELPEMDKMKFGFDHSSLHKGKVLLRVQHMNFAFGDTWLWKQPLDFLVTSGERIAIKGANGSGKTTLVKLLLDEWSPSLGTIQRALNKTVYIDQEYSLIDNRKTVYEQAQQANIQGLQEHEIKIRLNRFLFAKETWDKPCHALSGGEKMRLLLCCLTIGHKAPDIIVLDEPTNNLDIQNIEILTNAINEYEGTLLVVSHDTHFLEQIKVSRTIVCS